MDITELFWTVRFETRVQSTLTQQAVGPTTAWTLSHMTKPVRLGALNHGMASCAGYPIMTINAELCSHGVFSESGGRGGQTSSDIDPEPHGQYVGQEQRREEHLQELGREDAALLHNPGVPYAERSGTFRVL